MPFAQRLQNVETSAIRELFKVLGKPGIISFAGGFPDPALFDVAGMQAAAQQALAQWPDAALQYGATEGFAPLKEQIAAHMASKGAVLDAQQFIITTGSQQALDLISKCMLGPGDKVIVEAPTFLAAIQCFRLYGAQTIAAPIDAEGVQTDQLEALIAEHKPKLIYLIPTFGNPSGATLSLARRKRVLELAAQYQTLVIEDDPYGDLYFDAPPPPSLLALAPQVPGSADWLAHCGSLSKILAPGLRLGWLVAPPALLANAVMCKQFSDANTSTLAQATAAAYLQSGRLPAAVAKVRQAYAERARHMGACLREKLGNAAQFTEPQGGMFYWLKMQNGVDAASYAQRAIAQGVAFVPGAAFFAETPDPACLRMSFATANPQSISEGVERMAQALKPS
ncbi:MAG: PLP-dependent aminotransferase family protein [Brachymonas sp.]|nr:PLP-dependent aminotransferase family protein [Brachymonas sp.]